MSSTQDIYVYGLDMMAAALDAPSEGDARRAVAALVKGLSDVDAQRVATLLAVETVWHSRPRRSKRAFREWVDRRRFQVLMSTVELSEGPT